MIPLPGPSAILAALVGSGFPAVPFSFLGFVPRRGRERTLCLDRVCVAPETVVIFESPSGSECFFPSWLNDVGKNEWR